MWLRCRSEAGTDIGDGISRKFYMLYVYKI